MAHILKIRFRVYIYNTLRRATYIFIIVTIFKGLSDFDIILESGSFIV